MTSGQTRLDVTNDSFVTMPKTGYHVRLYRVHTMAEVDFNKRGVQLGYWILFPFLG